MPASIAPYTARNFLVSEARRSAIQSARSGGCTDIQTARDRITQMGIWDTFLDWAVRDRFKAKALQLIADKVCLDMATGDNAAQAEQLEMQRLDVNLRLIDLLSSRGKSALYGVYEMTNAGVLFKPNTMHDELNELLSIIVSPQQAGQIVRNAHGADAAAIAFQKWANKSTTLEQRAELYAYEARAWGAAKACAGSQPGEYDIQISVAWGACALACDASAGLRIPADAEMTEIALDALRAGTHAAKSAALAWQQAGSAAATAGNEMAVHYQEKAVASDATAARYTNCMHYGAWARPSADDVVGPELFRQKAIAWTRIEAHAPAAEAWLGRAVACSGKATLEMRGVRAADLDDARARCQSAAGWVHEAATAYERAATSAHRTGDVALAAESRERAMAEHRYAHTLLAAAQQDDPIAAMDPRRL